MSSVVLVGRLRAERDQARRFAVDLELSGVELQRRAREALAVAQGMDCSCTYGDSGWTCESCQIQDLLGVPEVTG